MFILSVISLIAVLIILVFVYKILSESSDDQISVKIQKERIIDEIKTSSIDESIFIKGLSDINLVQEDFKLFKAEISKKIIGMDDFINAIMINMLVGGHLLVEGVPGLAKTKTIETISKILDMDFKRAQFTPDMLPSDIIGVEVYNAKSQDFEIKKGMVFTNIFLADEINRTTPKVQSALLEAMQEKKISIGGNDFQLPDPFFVLATQNPIEQEGTYPLPEAQIDRFLFKILVNYPTIHDEKKILDVVEKDDEISLSKIMDIGKFKEIQKKVKEVDVSDNIKDYITRLIDITRKKDDRILYGCSVRACLGLMLASKALAYLEGRDYVTHYDIQRLSLGILRHRIILTYESKVDGLTEDLLLIELLSKVSLE